MSQPTPTAPGTELIPERVVDVRDVLELEVGPVTGGRQPHGQPARLPAASPR